MIRTLLALLLIPAAAIAQDVPVSADPRLEVKLFAAAPDIVQPIAMDFDAKGRLLVVESHTHFRPAKYDGPKTDRIRVLEDTDGDGKADKFSTFFEGTTATMDVAVHHDGSVYIATRNEILRLRDTDGDGKADEKTRIAFLETAGNYPHNGLAGLAFNFKGDLFFGMGENLGADYKLIGSGGTVLTGGGEGGGVFTCTADGKKLRRIATGFWNPFGAGFDIFGRLFVVDNDPDSSPPCRMVRVVDGGDYGFQFRYGRAGRHAFQSWNGELPGTLPYVAGTGESPCEVISYESDGLPSEYRGQLLVPAWADHRVERYEPKLRGAGVFAERKPFIQGGRNFYPSGLGVAPDGSLFVSDWGSKSYELHGKGAVWQIRKKDAKQVKRIDGMQNPDRKLREAAARDRIKSEGGIDELRKLAIGSDVRVRATAVMALIEAKDEKLDLLGLARNDEEPGIREMAVRALIARRKPVQEFADAKQPASVRAEAIAGLGATVAGKMLPPLLDDPDPFIRHAAIRRLALSPAIRSEIAIEKLSPGQRAGYLLALRDSGDDLALQELKIFLTDKDPDVRFLAVKWVSDAKLTAFRPHLAERLDDPKLDPRGFIALTTALGRLDDKPVNDDGLADYFVGKLIDKSAPLPVRLMALRSVNATGNKLKTELLAALLKDPDTTVRVEALRALKDRGDAKTAPLAAAMAKDDTLPTAVRAQAVLTWSALGTIDDASRKSLVESGFPEIAAEAMRTDANRPFPTDKRPAPTDTAAWLKLLEGEFDLDAGRRIFEGKLANCSACHRVDGRGANVGPDLSLIGRTERKWIVESILQPSAVIAPHFQNWRIETVDGKSFTGVLVRTYLDESEYLNEKGQRVKVLATDVADAIPLKTSIMPEKLLDRLTVQEIRDLVAYLSSRR
ncbi:MAG: PVC-type heme-binding CxxCH protein [Gemmataceae bacterium]